MGSTRQPMPGERVRTQYDGDGTVITFDEYKKNPHFHQYHNHRPTYVYVKYDNGQYRYRSDPRYYDIIPSSSSPTHNGVVAGVQTKQNAKFNIGDRVRTPGGEEYTIVSRADFEKYQGSNAAVHRPEWIYVKSDHGAVYYSTDWKNNTLIRSNSPTPPASAPHRIVTQGKGIPNQVPPLNNTLSALTPLDNAKSLVAEIALSKRKDMEGNYTFCEWCKTELQRGKTQMPHKKGCRVDLVLSS